MRFKYLVLAAFSGILLGLSTGVIPGSHLAFMEWFGFVPLFMVLTQVSRFRDYFIYTLFTFLIFFIIAIYSFFSAFFAGGLMILIIGSVQFSVPIMVLYFFKKKIGWKYSLLLLPFIWTVYEYVFIQSRFSIALLSTSVSQAPYLWLVQYADILGSGAITFWIALLNVLLAILIFDWREHNYKSARGFLIKRFALILLMFLIPLSYSFTVFNSKEYSNGRKVTVSLIQPNINPQDKWHNSAMTEAVYKTIDLTDSLLKVTKTDLVIWPEVAVPYVIMHEKNIRDTVFGSAAKWNTALLTGTVDMKYFYDSTEIPPLVKYLHRRYELYNAAMMITPQLASLRNEPGFGSLDVKTYKKNNLMPVTEYFPYANEFPVLSNLCLDFGGGTNWSPGIGPKTLLFADGNGNRIEVSPVICWDILYPKIIVESAKENNGFLAFISNEGWFGKSITAYEIENFTRLRSIETRRSIAKCGNTGYTFFTDPYGEVYGKIPWWQPLTSTEKIRLSSAQTFYMNHSGLFPDACAAAGLLMFIYFIKKKKRIINKNVYLTKKSK